MSDDSAKAGTLGLQASKDVEAAADSMADLGGGQFPLAPVGARQDSITQAHVGKGCARRRGRQPRRRARALAARPRCCPSPTPVTDTRTSAHTHTPPPPPRTTMQEVAPRRVAPRDHHCHARRLCAAALGVCNADLAWRHARVCDWHHRDVVQQV
jgi:hypothetical protein